MVRPPRAGVGGPEPPRLAMWLLRHRVPEHEREFFIGDLVEAFHAAGGSAGARRRFWHDALAASVRRTPDPLATPFHRGPMTDLTLDLSLAVRRLRRTPGFTLAASLTLALGVGAACAMYAVARPALWGTLPFTNADQIVTVRERSADGSASRVGYTTVADLERSSGALVDMSAVSFWSPALTDQGDAERLTGISVSDGFLRVMGVRPALGRDFRPEEDRPGAPRVVMLTHGLWKRRFGGDTAIVGRATSLNEVKYQVVGVLPASFESLLDPGAEIIRPLQYLDTLGWACRSCRHLQAVARLRDGVSPAAAAQEIGAIFARMRAQYPQEYGQNGVVVTRLRDQLTERVRGPLYALLGAAVLLLLIALANVTNLFIARAVRREGEVGIRAALGASRWRLTRSVLVEGLLVSLLGALFGAALAQAGIGTLIALAPPSLPRLEQVQVDAGVAAVAFGLALLLGAVCGLVPGAMAGARRAHLRLNGTSRTVARGGRDTLRRGLVVAEVSLALMLLAGAGILVQSVQRLLRVDIGFLTDNRLSIALSVSGPRFEDEGRVHDTWRAVRDAAGAVPGVLSASLTSQLPMSGDLDGWGIHLERAPRANPAEDADAFRFAVTPDYAATMGLGLRGGRFLHPTDLATSERVVVINEHMARRDFAGRSPLGERLKMGGMDGPWRTIVGVVADVQHNGLDADPSGQLYLPLEQNSYADAFVRLVVHSQGDPLLLLPALRRAITGVEASIPLAQITTLDDLITSAAIQRRFAQRLFQVFALSALLLAAVGIFSVISGMVGERTREIGVRSALGASRSQIIGHFVRQGAGIAAVGVAVGVVAAMVLSSALRPLVYGISPRDPLTLAAVALALGPIAVLATLVPSWRASRVDPVLALRAE